MPPHDPTVPAGAPPQRDPTPRALLLRLAFGALTIAACFVVAGYWVEAEKETRVLCALSRPGTAASEIDRLFGTATLMEVARDTAGDRTILHVSSARNLRLTGCDVVLEQSAVVRTDLRDRFSLAPPAAVVALLGMGALMLFQLGLAAGAPLGRLAWGGRQERLGTTHRLLSGLVAAVLLVGLAATAQLTGFVSLPWMAPVAETVVGLLTLVFTLSVLANLASGSRRERWTGAPLALLLACCGVVMLLAS